MMIPAVFKLNWQQKQLASIVISYVNLSFVVFPVFRLTWRKLHVKFVFHAQIQPSFNVDASLKKKDFVMKWI